MSFGLVTSNFHVSSQFDVSKITIHLQVLRKRTMIQYCTDSCTIETDLNSFPEYIFQSYQDFWNQWIILPSAFWYLNQNLLFDLYNENEKFCLVTGTTLQYSSIKGLFHGITIFFFFPSITQVC